MRCVFAFLFCCASSFAINENVYGPSLADQRPILVDNPRPILVDNPNYGTKFCAAFTFGCMITAGWQLLKNKNAVSELNKKAIVPLIGKFVFGGTMAGILRLLYEVVKWKYVSYDEFCQWKPTDSRKTFVKTVIIPNSVTSIRQGIFACCKDLTNIEIPNSVTSIGQGVFACCKNLTNIEIPNSVTSIGKWAFYCCSSLTNVTISNSVTSIDCGTFCQCSNLKNIIISNSITVIKQQAFSECSNLTNIEIPNSVTKIGQSAFAECSSLTNIEIPNSVTSIGENAFINCKNLNSVTFKGNKPKIGRTAFHGSSITQIFVQNPEEWSKKDLENMGLDPDNVQIKQIGE